MSECAKGGHLPCCAVLCCAVQVVATPDVETFSLRDGDEFIILACDGIWDVMSNQEVRCAVLWCGVQWSALLGGGIHHSKPRAGPQPESTPAGQLWFKIYQYKVQMHDKIASSLSSVYAHPTGRPRCS